MANDDRILLNLVLNEATVSAVEGRVRNLVNRLNNQNISLNINGRNLDNIVNRLNDIQQRMQTINSTPVNINANLTSAQQQYRLETERMRVAQQLELSRQRTLQTENQAISALAQQNRTLTVNNNITHQIEQGAQNIGHNMNVAGGHARDFVDYLADGVRYIIVYRSLYEIMNQVGEAFSEMKNVDKNLIAVRKTTGMAENEIEKIRKASYGVATEYGRTASEYLGSVSEFARGGYKELSTELAKVSLLTQNVGDINSEAADRMLLSIDAAYGLKGSVSELTNVVNGLNNIANLNPTSMQKMADGMQVSASMAKVAGLEISDLVALIGTGTAVTQREGGEIARAIRTITMNIRQVKGELEDGTVIDDDSIAKAEAALKGVGIATKEVVNGVRELRDPMDILDELAGKWSTLNTEAQSVVLESLANKRQANVLAAILENYEMVGKMQSEYFNSANSAVKENELYLQGWEATQKRVSAKWTEYIANMADTKVITSSLNALYETLVILDTPIGRIATQIVLVNTALAVSGRLWQAIRARSIVADILSMGVAERNLGDAIQLVSGHLGRQIAQWAASPFGMATIAVAGISLITSAISKYNQKLEESRQEMIQLGQQATDTNKQLFDLILQYKKLGTDGTIDLSDQETAKGIQEQINELLGKQVTNIDLANGKYDEQIEKLKQIELQRAKNTEADMLNAKDAAGESLESNATDVFGSWNRKADIGVGEVFDGKAESDYVAGLLRKVGMEKYTYQTNTLGERIKGSDSTFYIDVSNLENVIQSYKDLDKLRNILANTYSKEIKSGGILEDFYNNLDGLYKDLTGSVTAYQEALENYNLNQAVLLFNGEKEIEGLDLINGSLIENEEQMSVWTTQVIDSAEVSDDLQKHLLNLARDTYPELSSVIDDTIVEKARLTLESFNLSDATTNEIVQLLNEAGASETARLAIIEMIRQKIQANLTQINTSADVDNIIALANAAGASAQALADFARAKAELSEGFIGPLSPTTIAIKEGSYNVEFDEIKASDYKARTLSNSGGSKSSSDADKTAKKELEALKASLKTRKEILERYKKAIDLTDFGLDLAEENDFALRADLLNNKMSQITSYGEAMREEFQRASSIIPKTGEEAEALGSHLESLGDDMRSNITALRETRMEMEQLKIDSIVSSSERSMGELESALSDIERRIEILNSDNEEDYEYTNQILSLKKFLPTSSSLLGSQNGRRKADQDIINSEQTTQDILNDILATQIQKNENLREDEKNAILARMETMRQDVSIKLQSANIDYENYATDIKNITNSFTEYVSTAVNGMSLTVPKPDTNNFQKAANEIKIALEEINQLLGETPGTQQGDGQSLGATIATKLGGLSSGAKGIGAVSVARTALGVPYVWGRTNLGSGVDCSGLTYSSYQKMGVDIGRTTYSQWANSTEITRSQLKPGDLVFSRFGAEGKEGPAHVGMYVGNGKTIEAPSRGKTVQYSSVDKWERYGRPTYAKGTPDGNSQASRFGIAGENFKPEILIDKATGATRYIDKPTVIDITKTDVVGEKATANLPKYANGTIATISAEDIEELMNIEGIQAIADGIAHKIGASTSFALRRSLEISGDDTLSDREKMMALFKLYDGASDEGAETGKNAYKELLGRLNQYISLVGENKDLYDQDVIDAYLDGLNAIEEKTTEMESNSAAQRENLISSMEEDLAEIDNYIEKHNFYNDWDIIGDTEADAIERQMDIIRKYYDEGIISKEEYFKRSEELTREHIEAERRFYDSFFDDIESEISNTYDIRISRLNSHSSLLSTHFNLVNSIEEEQHNLNKELLEAETIGARMNEQERETLFTKKEHTQLSSKLKDIMADVNVIQRNYQRDLATATEDTIEEITNNYERQYELKMKEYEIVKAELSLAKAQQQLENVKNERSVRTWTGSGWGYESNLQDVLEAQSAAEDARYEVLKAKTAESQETALNAIDAEADALQTEKNIFLSALEKLSDGMDTSGRNIDAWLKTIAETDLPMFDKIVRAMGDSIKQALGISDEDISSIRDYAQHYNDTIAEMKANSKEWHTATPERQGELEAENVRLAGLLGLDWEDESGRWKKANGNYAYANGTKNAHKGLGLYDEEGLGSELILRDGVLTQFQGGEHVFSSEMADRLWQMAQQNYNFVPTIVQPDFSRLMPIEDKISNAINNAVTNNSFGDTIMVKDVHINDPDEAFRGFVNYMKKVV